MVMVMWCGVVGAFYRHNMSRKTSVAWSRITAGMLNR